MSRSNVRKGRIPGTLVLNWQSPEAQHGKTLTRRPMTACEACRTAKVKCDAQRECGRCKARGLRCRYLTRGSAGRDGPELDTPLERNLVGPEGGSSAESQESSQMLPDLPIDLESGTLQTASDAIDWEGDGAFNRALEQFDWVFSDTNLTTCESLYGPSLPEISLEDPISLPDDGHRAAESLDFPECMNTPPAIQQRPSTDCQCRSHLISHVPRLECTMQEKPTPRLDTMLKVTEDVIVSCQTTTNCKRCKIGPVDLVCIVTVFQQTATCFDHIAKSSLDGNMKVGVGAYEVSLIDDITFKRMLVVNLVKQASSLLDSLNALGQNLFLSQRGQTQGLMNRSPACLNQLNLNYVREVTGNFKTFFRLITNVFDERGSQRD